MAKIFESLRMKKPRYSAFDLSHEKKLSCKMGELIPILNQEILPGDSFAINSEVMLRFAPMIAPVMHRVNVYVHYFFVPNRIIWDEWEDFITGGREGTSNPTVPTMPLNPGGNLTAIGGLGDYLGIPFVSAGAGTWNASVSELPFRAYLQIYNDYYRDQNLEAELDITSDSELVQLRMRAWEKDYFTSALPWTQRGTELQTPFSFNPQTGDWDDVWDVSGAPALSGATPLSSGAAGDLVGGTFGKTIDNTKSLGMTINDLRQTSALQRWLERQARGGARYIETILSHFDVKSSDARMQRAEYLGGGRQPVVISEVLNTSATATEAQGTMAGHGISVGTANRAKKRFEEHGWLFGIMSVLPRTAYQQGLHRSLFRTDKFDYFWPELANIGEQEIQQKEIYYDKNDTQEQQDAAFGYQQRYAEYKYGCSTVHGDFKDNLDFWHMGRIFSSAPALNNDFVKSNPTDRIFAVTTDDTLWVQVYNSVRARRPMPYYANPQLS